MKRIGNRKFRALVSEEHGGSLIQVQFHHRRRWHDLFQNAEWTHNAGARALINMGPWTARMLDGKFPWNRETGMFEPGAPLFELNRAWHQHALHGYFPRIPWRISNATAESVALTLDSNDHPEFFVFPSRTIAELIYRIEDSSIVVDMTVRNAGTEAMPVAGGSHMFGAKAPLGALHAPTLKFQASGWYAQRADHPGESMPTGILQSPFGEVDFSAGRVPVEIHDNSYAGWDGKATATWAQLGLTHTVTDESEVKSGNFHLWWNAKFGTFAFEPTIASGNAFNIATADDLVGVRILQPGQESRYTHRHSCAISPI